MRKLVFLFISIFSLFALELGTTSGSTKLDKPIMVMDTLTIKTVKNEAVADSLAWKNAEGTYYDPKDKKQTKKHPDGRGTSGRKIKSGSVGLSSEWVRELMLKEYFILIQIKDCNKITRYGKGIFCVDDCLNPRYDKKKKFHIDFYHKDVTFKQKQIGRFKIKFRVYKIITPDGKEISPSGFLIFGQGKALTILVKALP